MKPPFLCGWVSIGTGPAFSISGREVRLYALLVQVDRLIGYHRQARLNVFLTTPSDRII